ncbi:MAG: serine protease [Candidatus Electrothrix sp. AR5]|nr:serine protease [Candidatus Electrothrix sp. AR5]
MADWKRAIARVYSGCGKNGQFCGTAFMVSDRHLLTCWHVVRDAPKDTLFVRNATSCGGGELPVRLVASKQDVNIDVALLELKQVLAEEAEQILLPASPYPIVKDKPVELAGYASEERPHDYFEEIVGQYEPKYNMYAVSVEVGKGMSGGPMLYLEKLAGISRLQGNGRTYLIPFSDFQDLLNNYVLPQQVQTGEAYPVGTIISTSQFDKVLREKVNKLFDKQDVQAVKERIFKRAGRKSEDVTIGDLLCSADVRIEQAIGWLTIAAAKAVQDIPCEEGLAEQREALKENARKILGWLVLRAVDSAWVEENGHKLLQEQNAQVRVCFAQPTGVEIIVARVLEQQGNFQGDSRKLLGRLAVTSLSTEGGIEVPDNEKALFALIWKKIVRIPPLEEGFELEKHLKTLQDYLESRYWTDTFDYLILPVDGLEAQLSLQEIQKFHQKVPFIKLVLLQSDEGQSALLVDDGKLHWQIARFFEQVIEERND